MALKHATGMKQDTTLPIIDCLHSVKDIYDINGNVDVFLFF